MSNDPDLLEAPTDEPEATTSGYVVDFISGKQVRATPEETEAVQVFAKRLVDDFGYPKEHIKTRPQHRVRRSPSDTRKSYPVDIAVFNTAKKTDDQCYIIVECKSETVKQGRRQLEIYLSMSEARIGVWFNGRSHLYLLKEYQAGGEITYRVLPTLPRYGQRVEDIGLYARQDLQATRQLKSVLRDIRNHLAGNVTGITRDEPLAEQIIDLLFCKIFDETTKGPDELVDVRAGIDEPPAEVRDRILSLFSRVKDRYSDVFEADASIVLDEDNLTYVVGELQTYCITQSERDVIGDAFEVFMGPALRGEEGQFFTPRNVVHMMIDILDPKPEESIIDPACGTGGFLITALDHIWRHIDTTGKKKKWTYERIRDEQRYIASRYIKGIEKDRFLSKVAKSYMAILGDGRGGIFCDNSLLPSDRWDPMAASAIHMESFDVVVTNPPFGTKIPVKGADVLKHYTLGYRAKRDKQTGRFEWGSDLHSKQPPQLLFIERCLQLLKPGGRMGIVIPESILGMPTYSHIVQFLRDNVRIVGVVSMPEELFQPHTHAKTAVLFVKKVAPNPDDPIFMSVVEWCGHDSRGNPTLRLTGDGHEELLDDIPQVAPAFREMIKDF